MSAPWKRNLSVPFFSQRENTTEWLGIAPSDNYEYIEGETAKSAKKKGDIIKRVQMAGISCNVSCLAMMLHFLGVTTDTPDQMMDKVFANATTNATTNATAEDIARYLKYSNKVYVRPPKPAEEGKPADLGENLELFKYRCVFNIEVLKEIAIDIYDVRSAYSSKYTAATRFSLDDIKAEIAAGFPVMVSCGIVKSGSSSTGHYVVIRGFTNEGHVIINDPWGKATDNEGDIPVNAVGVDIRPKYSTYQASDTANLRNNDENNGENIVILIDDFKRQIIFDEGMHKFHEALTLYDRRWSFPFSGYELEWVVEGEGDEAKFVITKESKEKHYRLESPEVHFPLTNTGTPHLGIHVTGGSKIQSIGSGQVIAAKLAKGADEDIPNGSNCMLLVRHQIKIADTNTSSGLVKVFFVLYMHLDPILDEISTKISDDSSTGKTPYSFVNELLAKRNHRDGVSIRAKLDALAAGELVILNNIPNLFLEIREGDFIGNIGLKGFYATDARRVLHLEIFSSTNIVDGIADFKTELDISGIENPLNREEVIKAVKEPLFCDYQENLCYYDYDGISPKEIERFFRHHASHATRAITLKAKAVADSFTDFAQNIRDSVGIWIGSGEDTEEFIEHNIKPYLWWTPEITTALDGLAANSAVYYYHPIHFLHWLMTNDEELYAQICPITEGNEVVAAVKDALAVKAAISRLDSV